MAEDVAQITSNNPQALLLNYDDEWLYIGDEFSLYRVKREGSEYSLIISQGVESGRAIDVVDNHVFYRGTDGNYYMDGKVIATPAADSPFARRITIEATVIENSAHTFVSPNNDVDIATLGERVNITPTTGAEILNAEGEHIQISAVPIGAKINITYEGCFEGIEYTSLQRVYRIVRL